MLGYKEFKEMVKRELQRVLGETYLVVEEGVVKNNGVELEAFAALRKEDNVSPLVYVSELYEHYKMGAVLEDIVEQVAEKMKVHVQINAQVLEQDFWDIYDQISMTLVNKELNKKKLEEVVTRDFLDLVVIFKIKLHATDYETCSCTITKQLLKNWGITEEALCTVAWKNLQKEQAVIRNIMSVISGEDVEILELDDDKMLHILSNRDNVQGAVMMMRKEVLRSFADRFEKNLYLLPSSIHECMLLVDNGEHDVDGLKQMVQEINQSVVDAKEVLSDSVYYYDREMGEVKKLC